MKTSKTVIRLGSAQATDRLAASRQMSGSEAIDVFENFRVSGESLKSKIASIAVTDTTLFVGTVDGSIVLFRWKVRGVCQAQRASCAACAALASFSGDRAPHAPDSRSPPLSPRSG
jgi:hypothetical protein